MGDLTAPEASVIAAAIVGGMALLVGAVTVLQKSRNDRRDAWWKRAQWAIDKSLSRDAVERDIGNRAMGVFYRDPAVSDADVRVLREALLRSFEDTRDLDAR
jgi:hypothetical protein